MLRWLHKPAVQTGLVILALVAVALLWRALPVGKWIDAAAEPIRQAGPIGAVGFVLVYVLAVVLLAPGSALTLAGSYLYGFWIGMLLVSIGSTIGAFLAFMLARTVGRERVRTWLARDLRFQSIDRAVGEQGAWVVFLLRLTPLVPFNLLNFGLGLTSVRPLPYLLATWLGMLPGTMLFVLVGAGLGAQKTTEGPHVWYWVAIFVTTLLATGYVGRVARRAIEQAHVVEPTTPADTPAASPD